MPVDATLLASDASRGCTWRGSRQIALPHSGGSAVGSWSAGSGLSPAPGPALLLALSRLLAAVRVSKPDMPAALCSSRAGAMTVKRRCHGRNKKGRGHVNRVRCVSTGKAIPKDKAIKRFIVRTIVEASALRDIKEASCIEGYMLPKIYIKQYYCIEAAIHQRVVRVRSRTARKNREPPQRAARPAFKPEGGAAAAK